MPWDVIERFEVSRLQLLDEEGNIDKELEPDLDERELVRIYRAMLVGREVDQRMLKL